MEEHKFIHYVLSSGLGKAIFLLLVSTTIVSGLFTAVWTQMKSSPRWGGFALLMTALCGFCTALLALFGACPGR